MANRKPKYLITDSKSVLVTTTLIVALGALLLALQFSGRTRAERLSELEGTTDGQVKTIEENDNIQQSGNENDVVIDSYTLEFEYTVDGIVHYGKDNIKGQPNSKTFVNQIIASNFEYPIEVKYSLDDPTISMIHLPDLSEMDD